MRIVYDVNHKCAGYITTKTTYAEAQKHADELNERARKSPEYFGVNDRYDVESRQIFG